MLLAAVENTQKTLIIPLLMNKKKKDIHLNKCEKEIYDHIYFNFTNVFAVVVCFASTEPVIQFPHSAPVSLTFLYRKKSKKKKI